MFVPAPIRYHEEVTGLPLELFAFDFAYTTTLDDIIELVRRVTVLVSRLVQVKGLYPAGKRREGRAAGDRVSILETFAVKGACALGQHLAQRAPGFRPLIHQRFQRLARRSEQTRVTQRCIHRTIVE